MLASNPARPARRCRSCQAGRRRRERLRRLAGCPRPLHRPAPPRPAAGPRSTPHSWRSRCPRSPTPRCPPRGAAGASFADFRMERIATQSLTVRDTRVQSATDAVTTGYAVRVLVDGAWGFAASVVPTTDEAAATARQAVAVARALAPVVGERVERADEPIHADRTWVSSYRVDPFAVPAQDKIALLLDRVRTAARLRRGRAHQRRPVPGQGEQVLRRHRGHVDHAAACPAAAVADGDRRRLRHRRVRDDVQPAPRRSAAATST